jgi:Zn-dependent peptidase ImmA (M78 family)
MEKEANLFAAELLLSDEDVTEVLNSDNTFFTAAATLCVPIELLDFKFRIMKRKGYQLAEPPVHSHNDFLKKIKVENE